MIKKGYYICDTAPDSYIQVFSLAPVPGDKPYLKIKLRVMCRHTKQPHYGEARAKYYKIPKARIQQANWKRVSFGQL